MQKVLEKAYEAGGKVTEEEALDGFLELEGACMWMRE